MKARVRTIWKIVAALLPALFVAGTGWAQIPKDVLVIATGHSNFKSMDPAVCYEAPTSGFVNNFYAKLVFVNNDGNSFSIEPDLAEKWSVAGDGKTWEFSLRKDLVFANGDPLTAEDVVYSLKRVIALKQSPSWQFTDVLGLDEDSFSAKGAFTVVIRTNGAPENEVLSILGATLGGIVNRKQVEKHVKDGDMGKAWLAENSAGAGRYVLKEWKRNIHMLLLANSRHWKGAPQLKTVILRDVPEASDQLLLVKKGDVDIATDLIGEQIAGLKNNKNVAIVTTPGQTIEYVGMNAGWGPFKDNRVRQAVKYAIDYDAMINKVRNGYAIKNQQFLAKGYFGYKENNPFSLNLEKAKKLMAEAGYADGFEVEMVTNSREVRRNEAVVVQQNLAAIGIKASINIMPAAQMYAKFRKQGINLIVAGWGIDYPDANALTNPFCNHRVNQLAWRLQWMDDKAADMSEKSAKELDATARKAQLDELTAYWQMNGPFATLLQPIKFFAVNKSVKGAEKALAGYSVHVDFAKMSK